MVDFIGVGAQKAGTSWMYACLYEHPEICVPIKEIHYFSRERNFKKGIGWYEDIFNGCKEGLLKGEFSTTYLYDKKTPEKIKKEFPYAKIIISLRNPVERAYSHYRNEIKGGHIPEDQTFRGAMESDESIVGQGMYYDQVKKYIDLFGKENVLVLILDDSKKDPRGFIKNILEFLNVDTSFTPSMLEREVNIARTPCFVWIERIMMHTAEFLRRIGLGKIVWLIKKGSIPDRVRNMNTKQDAREMKDKIKEELKKEFKEDAQKLSELIGRNVVFLWDL
ncbi:MAG: sulfotransferase domain-containing protein [Candidatus Pacebacteria bacterium]|nr:sulfotransferase domain-containing protein [Candidatus Paceibacterota bacterium]